MVKMYTKYIASIQSEQVLELGGRVGLLRHAVPDEGLYLVLGEARLPQHGHRVPPPRQRVAAPSRRGGGPAQQRRGPRHS